MKRMIIAIKRTPQLLIFTKIERLREAVITKLIAKIITQVQV